VPTYRFDHAELRRRRKAAGKTGEGMALAVHRTFPTYYAYEHGTRVPPTHVLALICAELGCEPNDLLVPMDDDLAEVADALGIRSRRAQGLPDTVTDPAVLDEVADLLRGAG
jgi:transcriptional regulator with XRE-family HTH domain